MPLNRIQVLRSRRRRLLLEADGGGAPAFDRVWGIDGTDNFGYVTASYGTLSDLSLGDATIRRLREEGTQFVVNMVGSAQATGVTTIRTYIDGAPELFYDVVWNAPQFQYVYDGAGFGDLLVFITAADGTDVDILFELDP